MNRSAGGHDPSSARRQVGEILFNIHYGEQLFADAMVAADAASSHLSPLVEPQIGYENPEEAFTPKPTLIVNHMSPFTSENVPLFGFDLDAFLARIGPFSATPSLLFVLSLVQIYDLWERGKGLRDSLAAALSLKHNDVKSAFFADLNDWRQVLAHAVPATHLDNSSLGVNKNKNSLRLTIPSVKQIRTGLITELDVLTDRAFGERMASAVLANVVFPLDVPPT